MSVATNKIKSRIKSVTGAYKVTSAMKLVSTVKLQKWRSQMLATTAYVDQVFSTTAILLNHLTDNDISPFTKINDKAKKNLYVIVSSTLGLCGAYNANIFKVAEKEITPNDEAIILGKKAITHFANGGFKQIDEFKDYTSANSKILVNKLTNYIFKQYQKEIYKKVIFIYSEYKNSLVFIAKAKTILPLENEHKDENSYAPIFEPNKKELLENLLPFYLKSLIYSKLLESEVCEQASRSNAMENATKNAEEMLDQLHLEFNKARQAAITQEITEIVGASEAL